ncbi:MAG: hypothetical protein LBH80_01955 [Prevotellaceae bacterium]|jgi:hypothetical protein|nr:hypothetical protein [Prevotellaceae bacterium]
MKRKTVLGIFCFLTLFFGGNMSAQESADDKMRFINDEVVFTFQLPTVFNQAENYRRIHHFLDNDLQPYSGGFVKDSVNTTYCAVTDYLEVSANMFSIFAWYMSYELSIEYIDSLCVIHFGRIRFMEKEYFEDKAAWESNPHNRRLNMPEYSGKDIFIDKSFKVVSIRRASEKTANAALGRFDAIVTEIKNYLNRIVF